MAFWYEKFRIGDWIEHEYKYAGNFGKKGEKRQKKIKLTPEQVKLYNRIHKAKTIRRTIGLNFRPSDYWVTLTYKNGKGKDIAQVKHDTKNFRDRLGRAYKKAEAELKWMQVIEIGKRGGLHIHMVLNRIEGTDLLVTKNWWYGHPFFKPLYEEGQYEQLSHYMAKLPPEEDAAHPDKKWEERLQELTDDNYSYSTSRNLVRPEPEERKKYTRRTMERAIKEGPKPTPGYYIDKDSIRIGVNKITGWSYMYYTELPLKTRRRE